MAISTSVTTSWKQDLLNGALALSTDTLKMALYTSSATLGAATTAYSATNEVGNSGTYAAGGFTMVGFTVSASGTTGYIDWTTDPNWTTATITARGALIYDSTPGGKNAMATYDFGADKTSTAGTFTVVLPAAGASATITIA